VRAKAEVDGSDREFRQRERQNLFAALVKAGWKIYGRDGAAALLAMKPTTLISRMKALSIERPRRSPNTGSRRISITERRR
jgi:transcriptional regulator with GAF, ATPase, and Fis domain